METTFLISEQRTGSHMLQGALARHPGLRCCGEVFSPHNLSYTPELRELVLDYCGLEINSDGSLVDTTLFHNVEYLELVSQHFDFCKLAYDQVTPSIKEWLIDKKKLHLVRDNYLAVLVSWYVANQLRSFIPADFTVTEYKPVTVPLHVMRRFAVAYTQDIEKWSDVVTIKYHNLLHNWDQTIRQVQAYIGVNPLPLTPVTTKRITRPYREIITNWQELQDAGYGHWLDGD